MWLLVVGSAGLAGWKFTVVSPIVATEALWGVALSLLLIRRTELVGRPVLIGAAAIVAGSAVIGAYAG